METLSLNQVSDALKISIGTARNRLSMGLAMPPSFKVGRSRLFPADEFRKWVMEHTIAGKEENNDEIK